MKKTAQSHRHSLLGTALRTATTYVPAACAAVVVSSSALKAQTISVNLAANEANGLIDTTAGANAAGAIPIGGEFWNNASGNVGTLAGGTVIDDTGAVVPGLEVSWSSNNTYGSASGGATATSQNGALTRGYLDDGGGWTVDITSPFLIHDVYVIHATDQGSPAEMSAVAVGGQYYVGDGAGGTIPVNGSGNSWQADNWEDGDSLTESDHFLRVTGVVDPSLSAQGSSPGRAAIAGFQIVNSYAGTLSYWDTNGTTPGSGDAGGTWGTDDFWSSDSTGASETEAWTPGNAAVFSAGDDGTSFFTVNVSGTQSADAVWVQQGDVTFAGDAIDLSAGTGVIRNSGDGILALDSAIIANDATLLGLIDLNSASNSISGNLGIQGDVLVNANLSVGGLAGAGSIDIGGFALTLGGADDSSFIGAINGDAGSSLIKNGAGTFSVGNDLGSIDSITINEGTLAIDGAGAGGWTLAGAGTFRKTGGGTFTIDSTANPFTGKVVASGGILRIPDDSSLGAVPAAPVADAIVLEGGARIQGGSSGAGADVVLDANRGITINGGNSGFHTWTGFTMTVNGPIVNGSLLDGENNIIPGNLFKSDGGTLVLNGGSSHLGNTRLEAGTLDVRSTMNGMSNFSVAGVSTLEIGPGADISTPRLITADGGSAQSVINHTDGVLNITGTDNSNGTGRSFLMGHWGSGGASSLYNLSGGTLSSLGAELGLGWDSGNVVVNQTGGTANLLGIDLANGRNNAASYNLDGGTLNLGAAGIIDNAPKSINLGGGTLGSLASWSTTKTLNLTGPDSSIAPAAGHVVTLTGSLSDLFDDPADDPDQGPQNQGYGFSKDGDGALVLGGTGTYTGATTVNQGALYIDGTGTGTSPVTVNAGGTIRPGILSATGVGEIETLDLQNGSSSTFRLDFLDPDTLQVNAADGLSVTGTHSILPLPTGELLPGDSFDLFSYNGTIQGAGSAGFTLGLTGNPHLNFSLSDTGTAVTLTVDSIEPITWSGATDGNWDVNGTENWELDSDSSGSNFYDFDTVTFADGSANTDITVSGPIQIARAVFENDTDTFTFIGDGIGGPGGLEVIGSGTVRLFNDNSYTGDTLIEGGRLVVGDGTNGSLSPDTTVDVDLGGALELNLDPGKSFSSPVTLTDGTLRVIGSQTVSGPIASSSPSVIEVTDPDTLNATGAISGATIKSGDGAMTASNVSGTVTVAGGTLTSTGFSGNIDHVVEPTGTLILDYGTGGTYSQGVTVQGNGVGSPNFFLADGRQINFQRGGGLRVSTAPTTLGAVPGGSARLSGFDINGNMLTIDAEASGTVIDPSLQIVTSGFGYRMNIASGADTASGDLVINSDMPSNGGSVARAGVQVNLQKWGMGSVLLNGTADFPEGLWLREGSIILGGDERIADIAAVAFGDGDTSGTLVLNGFTETVGDLGSHNGNTGSSVINGSPTTATLVVNYNGEGRVFDGIVGGTGDDGNLNLTKSGTGSLTLTAPLAYTGTTSVNDGILSLATASLDDSGEVNLGGTGIIDLPHGEADIVGSLVIDGVVQADGTYGATGSGAENIDDNRFSGTGLLQVGETTGGGFAAYEAANNIVGAGPDVDSDGDSVSNGIEFVVGGVSDPAIGQNDLDKLPTSTLDATHLTFTFRRTDESAASNPFVEYGSDLTGWAAAAGGVDGVVINETDDGFGPGVDRVEVIIPRSLATGDSFFARLKVDLP